MRRSFALILVLLLAACGSDDPVAVDSGPADPSTWFDGHFDGEAFVLQRIELPPAGDTPVAIDLVASRVDFDVATNRLRVLVHVRNAAQVPLYAPARVGIGDFVPATIAPQNADVHDRTTGRWWYDYSRALGGGVLDPGEQSTGVLWILQLPGPQSFSFSAVARFSPEPDRPVLAGRIFQDDDRDGLADPDEPPAFGDVELSFPDGSVSLVHPGDDGRWSVPVSEPGLVRARWISPPTFGFAPVCLTTPNPLQVMLVAGADGRPQSFRHADFGIDPRPCVPGDGMPILLSEVPLDSLDSDPLELVDLVHVPADAAGGESLEVSVAFGGCSPDHPLAFVALRPADGADAARIVATIWHDDLGELCDAWFQVTRTVDVARLRRIWLAETGYAGPLTLEMRVAGTVRELVLD